MSNVSDKSCRESQNTHIQYIFFFKYRPVYEIMWKNIVDPDRPLMKIWRMRNACCILKSTNTHSEYVIFVTFPLQQWLHERASMLRYTCIAACRFLILGTGPRVGLYKTEPFLKMFGKVSILLPRLAVTGNT